MERMLRNRSIRAEYYSSAEFSRRPMQPSVRPSLRVVPGSVLHLELHGAIILHPECRERQDGVQLPLHGAENAYRRLLERIRTRRRRGRAVSH